MKPTLVDDTLKPIDELADFSIPHHQHDECDEHLNQGQHYRAAGGNFTQITIMVDKMPRRQYNHIGKWCDKHKHTDGQANISTTFLEILVVVSL